MIRARSDQPGGITVHGICDGSNPSPDLMSGSLNKQQWKMEFLNHYYSTCDQNVAYAMRYTAKYYPTEKVPSRATCYKYIKDYEAENNHIDHRMMAKDSLTVINPVEIVEDTEEISDFMGMSLLQLREHFRNTILRTVVQQGKANDLMGKLVNRLDVLLTKKINIMDEEELMNYLLALGKAIAPFAKANETYLNMLDRLKIKRGDIATDENKKDNNKLDVNITVKHTTDEAENFGDHEDDQ